MKQSLYLFCLFSTLLTIGFLWSKNKNAHKDFSIIYQEVGKMDKYVSYQENYKTVLLRESSKKKYTNLHLIKDYEKLKSQANLTLESSNLIHNKIYNTDLSQFLKKSNPYTKIALTHEDKYLARLYMKMALTHRLDKLLDSINLNKTLSYTPKLITMNEPINYHFGQQYPLHFGVINSVNSTYFHLLEIHRNDQVIQPSDFPFVFDQAQSKQTFKLQPKTKDSQFYPDWMSTRNHERSIIN